MDRVVGDWRRRSRYRQVPLAVVGALPSSPLAVAATARERATQLWRACAGQRDSAPKCPNAVTEECQKVGHLAKP